MSLILRILNTLILRDSSSFGHLYFVQIAVFIDLNLQTYFFPVACPVYSYINATGKNSKAMITYKNINKFINSY